MKAILSSTALILGLITSAGVYAAAPAGATGLCKDGTYFTGASKQGACRGHKGIQEWYATTGATAAVTTTASPVKTTKVTKTMQTTADVTSSTSSTGATGLCKDGTYYTGANKKGACRGHKGIQTWYADSSTTTATTKTAPALTPTKVTKTTTTSVSSSGAAPAGATGLCKDGSYHTGANKQGACRGHKGIQEWYGPATAGAAVGTTAAATTPAAPTAAAPAPAPEKKGMFSFLNKKPAPAPTAAAPATTTTTSTHATTTTHAAPAAIAAGGGAGKVWVNTESNVYHCEGSHWYGTTKAGSYMTEAAAQAAGARPTHGKACK